MYIYGDAILPFKREGYKRKVVDKGKWKEN